MDAQMYSKKELFQPRQNNETETQLKINHLIYKK